jgi:protein phosphatase
MANRRVCEAAGEDPAYTGMGTTVVCAFLSGASLSIGHVGDSRLYVLSDGKLTAQTRDDTWAATVLADTAGGAALIADHPMRNVLTNVLGAREYTEIHLAERELSHGEMLLLCSDGVHNVMGDGRLCELMSLDEAPDVIARLVVSSAIQRGSRDNATAIVVRYLERSTT